MTVSQNIAQPLQTVSESANKNAARTQAGEKQEGLFNSIFASINETDKQTESESSDENKDGKPATKADGDVSAGDSQCLSALMRQLSVDIRQAEQIKLDGVEASGYSVSGTGTTAIDKLQTGIVNRTADRLGQALLDMSSEGKYSFSGTRLEDIRRAAGELELAANELAMPGKPVSLKGEAQEEDRSEKSLKRLSEKLDALMSMLNGAGNTVPAGTEANKGMMDSSPAAASDSGAKESLRQIAASMQSALEQCNNFAAQKQVNRSSKPDPDYTSPVDRTISAPWKLIHFPEQKVKEALSTGKASDLSEKKQVFSSVIGKGGAEAASEARQDGDGKLSGISTPGSMKPGGFQTSLVAPVEAQDTETASNQGKNLSAGNNPKLSDVEVTFRDPSSTGGFSKGDNDASRNLAGNGKEKPDFANVNMGAHLIESTAQSGSQAQNAVSETSKPVSHEHIIAQVREKLSASGTNGDISRITLKLHPEDLGELKISMKMENQSLKVDIVTANQNVKEALIQNMDSLKETLSRQNISMDRFNVLTGGGFGSDDSHRQWRQTARNFVPDTFRQLYGFSEETAEKSIGYLDSSDNSLIDLRL